MTARRTLRLPIRRDGIPSEPFKDLGALVIVGANGSGKSRLGEWLEANQVNAHRISAQRALTFPDIIPPNSYEHSRCQLHYGMYEPNWNDEKYLPHKRNSRWNGEPFTTLLNDYQKLLTFLFADEARRDREYARSGRNAPPAGTLPKCKLDHALSIWSSVLPQRVLIVSDDRIQATSEGSVYQAREMSDGEKVALYLIGQSLSAPQNATIIIDEPEIHLHRSIQNVIWNELEKARQDCIFVYITHDLEFAASRTAARKLWLKDFDGKTWDWYEVDSNKSIPDDLLFALLGNRRPVLFVEGDEGSLDAQIYKAIYPQEFVLPRSGSAKVAESTKAFSAMSTLHHLKVRGIVDRDRRSEEEISGLLSAEICVTDVAEAENLLCIEEALRDVAFRLGVPEIEVKVAEAKRRIFAQAEAHFDRQVYERVIAFVQFRLAGFGPKWDEGQAGDNLKAAMAAHVGAIDVAKCAADTSSLLRGVLSSQDYSGVLRYFNLKSFPAEAAAAMGVKLEVFSQIIVDTITKDPESTVAEAMRGLVRCP